MAVTGFIRIQEERFKVSSVSRYKFEGKSPVNSKWYITIWFGQKERKFSFDSKEEVEDIIKYLDKTLGVREV